MHFETLGTVSLDLKPQLQWLWHSSAERCFVAGDDRHAFTVAQDAIDTHSSIDGAPERPAGHPCNLPIPDSYFAELQGYGWRGFQFLNPEEYDAAITDDPYSPGDVLRTLVFGPDYGLYLFHPPSQLTLALRSGTVQLVRKSTSDFIVADEARTRGRAALAFCAHPDESVLVYGDNYGNFHAHYFSEEGFGKTKKIVAKDNKASAVQFIDRNTLLIGGMGYLCAYSYNDSKFQRLHSVSGPVRDFVWNEERQLLFINQGLHGVAVFSYGDSGFTKLGAFKAPSAANQMAVSQCGTYVAVSSQSTPTITAFRAEQTA